jgi:broad specificity phosphatase PhoE
MAKAEQLAVLLTDKYVEVANVYCSDLRRSFNTARIICENTPWGKTQQVSPFIRDRDYGDLTGTQSQIPQGWKTSLSNGESLQDTASRVYSFLKEIEDRSNELPHIIICHSDTVRAAAVVLGKRTPHDIQNFEVYNTGEIIEWDF